MKTRLVQFLLSGTVLALPLCVAPDVRAQAQPSPTPEAVQTGQAAKPADDATLQEIVVTANKREERLNKVGLTVTALSGQTLVERRITTLSNLAAVDPGLTFAQSTGNTPILSLRGVGFNSSALGSYPAVSASIDQFPLPFPVLASHATYDLERVEVLKGPQGTLFGENATGGAINFIAAKPTRAPEAGGDISYGRFNDVLGNAYVSGPLTDTLRVRVAGTYENSDGWQISNSRPDDRNGSLNYGAGRILLDWTPIERVRVSVNLNGWVDKSQPQAPQFIALYAQSPVGVQPSELSAAFSPQNPRAADWATGDFRPRGDRKFYQAALRSDIDLTRDITVTSLTSYDNFAQRQTENYDGLPILITDNHASGIIRSLNEEVRFANAQTMPFRWIVGGNYENSKTFDYQFVDFSGNSTADNPQAGNVEESFEYVGQRIQNIAGFGNVEYSVTSQLTANAGPRYTHSRNAANLCTGDGGDGRNDALFNYLGSLSGIPFTPAKLGDCASLNDSGVPNISPTHSVLSENNVSWRGGVNYKVSTETLLYANISRGYKAGSFPLLPGVTTSEFTPVKQESVTAYEAGAKIDLASRRIHLNLAAFYYDYANKQVLGRTLLPIFGPSDALVNVPKSRIYGIDSDVTIRLVTDLTVTGSLTYLDSRIQSFDNAESYDALGNLRDLSGYKLPFAPEFSYSVDAEYRHPLSNGGAPFAGASVTGQSEQDTTISGSTLEIAPGPGSRVLPGLVNPFMTRPYATLDLRLGYEAAGGAWRIMAFGKNVLNKYYWSNVNDSLEAIGRFAGLPATYGMTLGFRFR